MDPRETVDITTLSLPDALCDRISDAPLYESSGQSGARTIYIDREGGAYLKIAVKGSLLRAAQMQKYLASLKMTSPVLLYLSDEKDYLLTESIKGEDGTTKRYLAEPERLSERFGQSLRLLHEAKTQDCPIQDNMYDLLMLAQTARFRQSHWEAIADYIGEIVMEKVQEEIASAKGLLRNDVLMHGDYCLPNIILDNWRFSGFIDVADAGIGDRHYDLAWGLWTLSWNLKSPKYGQRFLDAYGRDDIDKDRLRICGLLAAID